MPIVTILVTREGTGPGAERTTREQKAEIYRGIADLLFHVMGKPHAETTVVLHEHEIDDFGQGGLPLSEYRRQRARAPRTGEPGN
ncbi:tautomerase family protein [Burkholderia perseverans]|uniref:tautomerase family protein n=1 Tax=Burkholderia perseverans TaxID=2615214 RepID=UPI001FEEB94E|nr:4-oxalocrotonate tautomerase family protein [Burkholderia perseverans]